jgi:hypothetical protein
MDAARRIVRALGRRILIIGSRLTAPLKDL